MEQLTQITKFTSLIQMIKALPTDNDCRLYLENLIWNGSPKCPHCKSEVHYRLKSKGVFVGQYKCVECQQRYNVKDKTMFEGSHIGLHKWFYAIYLFSMHKKGISSHQLASDISITQKSAWFLLGRIRNAFKANEDAPKLTGQIQADETYVGGKTRNMHQIKQDIINAAGTGAVHANPVFGVMNKGVVKVIPVPYTDGATLMPIINAWVEKDATLVTDGHGAYAQAKQTLNHEIVNHSHQEYVRAGFHTNGIENFWSHLKRGIYGIYHWCSGKHLHRYCDEFAFRYNMRLKTVSEKFNYSLENSERLMYKTLIAK